MRFNLANHRKHLFVFCLITILFIVGSGSGLAAAYQVYDGPGRSDSEVAFLKSETIKITLIRVDDKDRYFVNGGYNYNQNGNFMIPKFNVAVLPGEHEFEMFVGIGKNAKMKVVRFTMEAGKTYLVDEKKDDLVIYQDKQNDNNLVSFTSSETPQYREPAAGPDAAVLRGEPDVALGKVKLTVLVHRIDGMMPDLSPGLFKSSPSFFNSIWNHALAVRLTPGQHTLIYSVHGSSGKYIYIPLSSRIATDNFEAGKTYSFEFKSLGETADLSLISSRLVEVAAPGK